MGHTPRAPSELRLAALESTSGPGSMGSLEDMLKNPEKVKQLQGEMEKFMQDPDKRKALEAWQQSVQGGVEKLRQDPELQDFFKDVQKDGLKAMKKYEKNEGIMRKFSEATGGGEGLASMLKGVLPGEAAPPSFKPGDEVVIHGLQAKPELNGQTAVVVPPTAEEREHVKGTGRLLVRLIDSGEQFAVKPHNLQTTRQGAETPMANMYSPDMQTEAARLRESGKLEELQEDPELKPIFEDIQKNGMGALQKYWNDEVLMAKITKAMGVQ